MEKDPDVDERGRRSTNMQSKSFRVLAHMTGTESGEFPVWMFCSDFIFTVNFHMKEVIQIKAEGMSSTNT